MAAEIETVSDQIEAVYETLERLSGTIADMWPRAKYVHGMLVDAALTLDRRAMRAAKPAKRKS